MDQTLELGFSCRSKQLEALCICLPNLHGCHSFKSLGLHSDVEFRPSDAPEVRSSPRVTVSLDIYTRDV